MWSWAQDQDQDGGKWSRMQSLLLPLLSVKFWSVNWGQDRYWFLLFLVLVLILVLSYVQSLCDFHFCPWSCMISASLVSIPTLHLVQRSRPLNNLKVPCVLYMWPWGPKAQQLFAVFGRDQVQDPWTGPGPNASPGYAASYQCPQQYHMIWTAQV